MILKIIWVYVCLSKQASNVRALEPLPLAIYQYPVVLDSYLNGSLQVISLDLSIRCCRCLCNPDVLKVEKSSDLFQFYCCVMCGNGSDSMEGHYLVKFKTLFTPFKKTLYLMGSPDIFSTIPTKKYYYQLKRDFSPFKCVLSCEIPDFLRERRIETFDLESFTPRFNNVHENLQFSSNPIFQVEDKSGVVSDVNSEKQTREELMETQDLISFNPVY